MVTAPNGAGTSEHFKLEDFPLGSKRPMRVAVIGTGFAGLTATIRLSQRLQNIELVTYEKNGSVGGTWCVERAAGHRSMDAHKPFSYIDRFENDYPGLCCDIPGTSVLCGRRPAALGDEGAHGRLPRRKLP